MSAKFTDDARLLLPRLEKWCAYRDRSSAELRKKIDELSQGSLPHSDVEWLFKTLCDFGYFDDKRFAESYVRGKFHNNKWGRLLIRQGLRKAGIETDLIAESLANIDEDEYRKILITLMENKSRSIRYDGSIQARQKIVRYAASKGFESDLVFEVLKELHS